MAKRFYKLQEKVWIKELNKVGMIQSLDIPNLEVEVSYFVGKGELETKKFKFMEIDKLKTEVTKNSSSTINGAKEKKDTMLVAKVHPNAKIPTREHGNAGFDVYACFDQQEIRIPKGKPTLISTGIAISLLPKYAFNVKQERGSTGLQGMAVLSGLVDSNYRGEVFVNICPQYKDIVISKNVENIVENENEILYPYSKAITQGKIELVPDVNIKEITYEQLKAIPSTRKDGKLGSSGK